MGRNDAFRYASAETNGGFVLHRLSVCGPAAMICPVSFLAPIKQTQHCAGKHAHVHTVLAGWQKSYLLPSFFEKPIAAQPVLHRQSQEVV